MAISAGETLSLNSLAGATGITQGANVSLGAIIKEDNTILTPRGHTVIEAGDKVVMFVPVKSLKKVEELLSVNMDFFWWQIYHI